MIQEKINKQIFNRLEKLEEILFSRKKKIKSKVDNTKSLADHILALRDRNIFTQPLIPHEVHKKLGAAYRCDLSRVKVELIRLQKRGQLRKTSKLINGKKYKAYVW